MESYDVFIVGGGAAGLSAARAAAERCPGSILLADRAEEPGGILRQCFHRGFGTELTGPEYIRELLDGFPESVRFLASASVLSVSADRTAVLSSPHFGLKKIRFRQMIYAAGCREVSFGSLQIAGTRPEGIYTAGQLQEMMNLRGFVPEGPAVILGSGDMGLVMAWQLSNAGVEIKMMVDKRESMGGLALNRKRLEGCSFALRMKTTVSRVFGEKKLEGVNICAADGGAEEYIPCRTLVSAAGLEPERDLIGRLGPQPWLTLCGNSKRVHGFVDGVVREGKQAGYAACEKLREKL